MQHYITCQDYFFSISPALSLKKSREEITKKKKGNKTMGTYLHIYNYIRIQSNDDHSISDYELIKNDDVDNCKRQ